MLINDRDMAAIQGSFGVLSGAVACKVMRGTPSSVTKVTGEPYVKQCDHKCTVLTPAQITNPFVASYLQSVTQDTRNARVILMGLPIPQSVTIMRGDYIVVGTDTFTVLDRGDNMTYQFQRVLYCQYAENLHL